MSVQLVTDSNTMIPPPLARRLGLTVVPLSVTIGGDEIVEDETLDLAAAYRRLRAGEEATTSAPSPGAFAATYARLAGDPIVSIHIGAGYSGTLNAARLGAEAAGVEVHLVDTANASFLAGMCVLDAADVAGRGGDADAVVVRAQQTASEVASVFTIAELERAVAGGRLGMDPADGGDGTPVLLIRGTEISSIATVLTADVAADAMVEHVAAIEGGLRLGVGDADAGPVVDGLVERLRAARPRDELIRYTVGPTVAAHAGMGTFGVVFAPR